LIKYGMEKNEENGFVALEDFLSLSGGVLGSLTGSSSSKNKIIDITKEFQETFVVYQNMFGNKLLDFNEDTSPFNNFNKIFASTGKSDLGTILL